VVTRGYGLDEIPMYVAQGCGIPTRTMDSVALPYSSPLVWVLFTANGSATVYEVSRAVAVTAY
jgi:hypothetical protein